MRHSVFEVQSLNSKAPTSHTTLVDPLLQFAMQLACNTVKQNLGAPLISQLGGVDR